VGVVDGSGRASTFAYDDHLLVEYGTEGSPPIATQTYDADGRLVATSDAAGVFVEHSTDLEAWTETTVGPDPDLTTVFAYDGDGLLTELTASFDGVSLTWAWSYDEAYRPVTEEWPSGAVVEVAYDGAGRPTDLVDADGVHTELVWTALGDLTDMWVDGVLVRSAVHDDAGHPLEALSPTGATLATWT
jgi:YD repeat-containing protein